MAFSYYNKLSKSNKRIYQQSDSIETVQLTDVAELSTLVHTISACLLDENQRKVQSGCQQLCSKICKQLSTPPVRIKILAKRPANNWGELHGLYEHAEITKDVALISVWMRTAKRKQVVAFKTFIRTVLHELCHHLDYEYLGFKESFHTEGFYKRENALFKLITNQN